MYGGVPRYGAAPPRLSEEQGGSCTCRTISSVEPEQAGYDDIFDGLKTVVSKLRENEKFPVWLLKDMQAIAGFPDRYSGSAELVALLVRQAENYDPYAGAGCFDMSVGADAIAATLKKIALPTDEPK